MWESNSYISMIDEHAKNRAPSQKDLLKDTNELKNEFMRKTLDENSPECFSASVKSHYGETKMLTAKILNKLLKYLLHLYNTQDGYMLIQDPHFMFISFLKCCSSFEIINYMLKLIKTYLPLVEEAFDEIEQFHQVIDELIIEKKEQFNTIPGIHSRSANRPELDEEKDTKKKDDKAESKSIEESSSFEQDEFVEEIVQELEEYLTKVTS